MLVPAGETEMATLGRSSDHQTVDNPMPGKGSNVSGDFVIDKAVGGEGEVDEGEMPEGQSFNPKFLNARNSVVMGKSPFPKKASHPPIPGPVKQYATFVATRPGLCWSISALFMVFFTAIGFIVRPDDMPDFSRADKGFDTRGSDLAGASAVMDPLVSNAICRGMLTRNSDGSPSYDAISWGSDDEEMEGKYVGTISACGEDYCCDVSDLYQHQWRCPNEELCKCASPPAWWFDDHVCAAVAPPAAEGCASLGVTDKTACIAKCGEEEGFVRASFIVQVGYPSVCRCTVEDGGAEVVSILCESGRRAEITTEAEAETSLSGRRLEGDLLECLEGTYNSTGVGVNGECTSCPTDRSFSPAGSTSVSDCKYQYQDRTCPYSHQWKMKDDSIRVQLVFAAKDDDVLDAETLKAMCKVDDEITAKFIVPSGLPQQIIVRSDSPHMGDVCWTRNLGNYVAYYNDLGGCDEITATHVEFFRDALKTCHPHYESKVLKQCELDMYGKGAGKEGCHTTELDIVPELCWKENIMWDTFNAIIDINFDPAEGKVKYTKNIVQVEWNWESLQQELHEDFLYDKTGSSFGQATLDGYKCGDKFDVFSKQLIGDNVFSGGAFVFVFALMWLHTSSGFITTFAFFQIFLNLGVAYGVYMAVFNLPFFPFLNLVGLFVVIGIGADDVFVFIDAWKQSVQALGAEAALEDRLAFVLYRAGGSMFITSLTTASAFAANAMSSVTALRCFGVFCAIVIIVDYFLMLCYIPALVVIYEKYVVPSCKFCGCCTMCEIPEDPSKLRKTEAWFKEKLGPVVIKGKPIFLLVLVGVAGFLGFHATKLERSTSVEFQLFKPEHPMERYDMVLKNEFHLGGSAEEDNKMGVKFVLGINAADNGNHWDPNDWGTIDYVSGFSLAAPGTQSSTAAFCDAVKEEAWYQDPCAEGGSHHGDAFCRLVGERCVMRNFKHWVDKPCADTTDDANVLFASGCTGDACFDYALMPQRTTCCGKGFPLQDEAEFDGCFKDFYDTYEELLKIAGMDSYLGIWWDNEGKVKMIVNEFGTTKEWSAPYEVLEVYYNQLVDSVATATKGGDASMRSLFFHTGLDFFDLQRSLSSGAYTSAGLSFLFAFVVLAVTTRSPILTVLSLLTIICIVLCIVGVLVLDGWQLNIMESVIISVAVGMSVDFVAHYSHSYLHSSAIKREDRVLDTVGVMGISVLTGATTTFVAGFFMSLAQTLFFFQFGVFMMSTMAFAFIYTNFMFAPLLAFVGPAGKEEEGGGDKVVGHPGDNVEISPY